MYVPCLICGSSILNYCYYFLLLVYALYISCGMIDLFVRYILVGSPGIYEGLDLINFDWQHVAREMENLNTEFKNVQQDAEIQYYKSELWQRWKGKHFQEYKCCTSEFIYTFCFISRIYKHFWNNDFYSSK
jgi:hypothetical protein